MAGGPHHELAKRHDGFHGLLPDILAGVEAYRADRWSGFAGTPIASTGACRHIICTRLSSDVGIVTPVIGSRSCQPGTDEVMLSKLNERRNSTGARFARLSTSVGRCPSLTCISSRAARRTRG